MCAAQNWSEVGRELARKILGVFDSRETVSLTVRNASSLHPSDVAEVRQALASELRAKGARLTETADAAVAVNVTLSENTQGLVWVAEIRQGEKRDVVILPRARPPAAPPERAEASVVLSMKLLWEQDELIVDVAPVDGGLLVLDGASISLKAQEPAESLPIVHSSPWPRDLRGRLQVEGAAFRAFLPGVVCTGSFKPSLTGTCHEERGEWPLGAASASLANGRNFFEGLSKLPPFFSLARAGDLWIIASVDGRVELYNQAFEPAGSFTGWGSEIAGLESRCGGGPLVLSNRVSDLAEPDRVQAFEIVDAHPVPVSAPLELPGPVTALWASAAGDAAVVAVRHLKSDRYVAFSLSVSCSP